MELLTAFALARASSAATKETLDHYEQILHIAATLGLRVLAEVAVTGVMSYVAARLKVVSRDSIQFDFCALRAAVRPLLNLPEHRKAARRALRVLSRLRPKPTKKAHFRAVHLTRAEFDRLVIAANDPADRLLVQVVTLSGLRAMEACRLRWRDVVLGSSPVLCVKIAPELGRWGRCKTGERVVPIVPELAAILNAARLTARPDDYIFQSRTRADRCLSYAVARQRLAAVASRAGLPHATFQVLRHTRATWWLQAGVSLAKVSAWIGNTPEVCARYYGHLVEGYDAECARVPASWAHAV